MSNPHPFFYFPELSSWVPLCIQTPCACVYTDKITLENCIIRTWTCDISLLFLWSFPSLPYPYGGRKAGRSLCTSPLPLPTSLLGSPGIRTTERLCWYRRKQASKEGKTGFPLTYESLLPYYAFASKLVAKRSISNRHIPYQGLSGTHLRPKMKTGYHSSHSQEITRQPTLNRSRE